MIVIKPNTDLTLLSSSIAESDSVDGVVWSAANTYNAGDRVRYNHVTYQSAKASNKDKQPDKNLMGDNAYWLKVGGTMPWRILDGILESKTTGIAGQPLSFSVPYHRATAFALLEVEGISVTVTLTDSEYGVYFEKTYTLLQDITDTSPWQYLWGDVITTVTVVSTGMAFDGTMTVVIDAGEGTPAVGEVAVGKDLYLGSTKHGVRVGTSDYSKKNTDDFGHTTLIRRPVASRGEFRLFVRPNTASYVHRVIKDLRSTPCVWIGDPRDDGHECLTIYGWYEDYGQEFEGPNKNELDLRIQGLI